MFLTKVLATILIIILSVLKPILYRPIAQKNRLNFSPVFTSVWAAIFVLLALPFFWQGVYLDILTLTTSPLIFIFCICKGVVSWYTTKYSQAVNKKSTSTVVFFPFVSLALASFVLNVFLGEKLTLFQLVGIIGLGVWGGLFCFYGAIKNYSMQWKKYFILAITYSAACPILDHLAISHIGWYTYFAFSNFATLFFSFIQGGRISDIKKVLSTKYIVKAGLINILREIVVLGSSVTILPVSLVNFSIRLAAPIVMVFSSIRYHESTVKNQLYFGIIALILALPIVLFM